MRPFCRRACSIAAFGRLSTTSASAAAAQDRLGLSAKLSTSCFDRAGERAEKEQKLQRQRHLLRHLRPLVGDRVLFKDCDYLGDGKTTTELGTVVFAGDFDPDGYDDGFTIRFDNGALGENFMALQLSRLLPGDPGFENPSTTATSVEV